MVNRRNGLPFQRPRSHKEPKTLCICWKDILGSHSELQTASTDASNMHNNYSNSCCELFRDMFTHSCRQCIVFENMYIMTNAKFTTACIRTLERFKTWKTFLKQQLEAFFGRKELGLAWECIMYQTIQTIRTKPRQTGQHALVATSMSASL